MFCSVWSFSQEGEVQVRPETIIEGYVYDQKEKVPLPSVTIKLKNEKDSSFYRGVATDKDGYYRLKAVEGKYIQELSFLGYETVFKDLTISTQEEIKQDTIFLSESSFLLGQITVEGHLPPMQVKGDTIEFNPGAYNIDGSTVLKDLIKQIPGLEMDANGVLKANGKAITKILVDGKEYFGSDINMALSTLPANMIKKLQLFEKESEEAKATGIKDANPEQVLNLDVKEEFKKSVFGDAKSGIGNKDRHTNRINANKMHGDNQYSVVGGINNINDSEYGSYAYANFDDNIDKNIGANFNIQESERLTINGSGQYANAKSRDEYVSDSYSSILNQYSDRQGKGINRRQNMDLNTSINWKPDSLTTIYFTTRIGYGVGDNISTSMDSARIVGKSTTSTHSERFSDNNNININNSLMFSRRLNSKGRSLTLSLRHGYNKSSSDGSNYSEKKYWETGEIDVIDQRSKNDSKGSSYALWARYVEPLDDENRLYFSFNTRWGNSDREGDVRRLDPLTGEYTLLDSAYSRITDVRSMQQNIGAGFQRSKEKYDLNINFSVDPSNTRNKTFLGDSILEDLKQNVINFSPSVRFSWKYDKNTFIDFSYNGSTNHPGISQLSADTVIHSAMSKSVGNSSLKPSFNNNFGVSYRKSDFESGRYFSASVNYSYMFNSTVSYQLVDENSNTINTYRNVDGNSNAYAYISFNTPLKNKKFNVGVNLNTYYGRNIGFINEKKNIQDRYSVSPSLFGRFNNDKLETNLNVYLNHNIGKNNLAEVKRSDNTDLRLTNYLKIKLPLDFAIESNFEFSYRWGLDEDIRKDESMWTLGVSKLFLKEKRGTLKFEFFDVLNDLRQQENTVSGSDYSNYWRRVVNNYFILSFSYRFNILQ